jgi:2-polyprenyl-6-methoxyphenol hydroxylase-like FAD-dependent oxidoreductase
MDRPVDTDVAIVGYGPVGNALAVQLAQLGTSVIVLERWPEPYPLPRAVHFDDEVGRILQMCGIGDEVRAISEPADLYEWRNGAGTTLLRFGRAGDGPSGWPASSMFNQPQLEQVLAERGRELGIDVRRGVEVTGIDQHDDGVTITAADRSQVAARYVVGCDGANSTVRALTGLPVTDLGYFYDWLIVDVILDEPRVFDPINLQICDPARPTTAVSGGPGRRRWEFMRLPEESIDDLNTEGRAWELLAPWDVHPGNARLERHAVYTFNARYADTWRDGRVFVAGDAAHLTPPFAGQGLCAGLRDATNLAWKLRLVLEGSAAGGLLDSYDAERIPSARAAIGFAIDLGEVICVPDPAAAAARDEAMAIAVGSEPSPAPALPDLDAGFIHARSPHAGTQFVQGHDDGRPTDEVHGNGWRLVTLAGEPDALRPSDLRWFGSIGGRVVRPTDPDEVLAAWFADHATTWALQRPDFYLYGTADDDAGATTLLGDLRNHLEQGTAP